MKLIDKLYDVKTKSTVKKIKEKQAEFAKYSDEQFVQKTKELKQKLQRGASLKDITVEAYALACAAACKELGYKEVFDSQIYAAITQSEGKISELQTGGGKTLVAALSAYLKTLTGEPVHVITFNDYLAKRDAQTMAPVFKRLGLSVGLVGQNQSQKEKAAAYGADVTYGTGHTFCFDYLNTISRRVGQKPVWRCGHAIVDEVDGVLIDEAISPFILTGASQKGKEQNPKKSAQNKAFQMAKMVEKLFTEDDVEIENNSVSLTYGAIDKFEKYLGIANLYDGSDQNTQILFYLNNALRARFLMEEGVDYIIGNQPVCIEDPKTGKMIETKEKTVILVDQNTGRPTSKRFSAGLHEAIEAREKLLDSSFEIKQEFDIKQVLTFQNYFKQYTSVSGMSGTVMPSSDEFREIFGVQTVEVDSYDIDGKRNARIDNPDTYCASFEEKVEKVCADIVSKHTIGRPILVVTSSVAESEALSEELEKMGIAHNLLNAKNEEKEAKIVADAGKVGMVTIATNMAGRGTDIKLGGSDEGQKRKVESLGGLYVIGFCRQKTERLDRQIIGRAGRQGDPGETRFYVSLDDEIFENVDETEQKMFDKICDNTQNGGAIKLADEEKIGKLVNSLQKKNESIAFACRKVFFKFDAVSRNHMLAFHQEREKLLASENVDELLADLLDQVDDEFVDGFFEMCNDVRGKDYAESLKESLRRKAHALCDNPNQKNALKKTFIEVVKNEIIALFENAKYACSDLENDLRSRVFIQTMDRNWEEHLQFLEDAKRDSYCHFTAEKPLDYFTRTANAGYRDLLTRTSREILMGVAMASQQILKKSESGSEKN